jgi:hypothetical protein
MMNCRKATIIAVQYVADGSTVPIVIVRNRRRSRKGSKMEDEFSEKNKANMFFGLPCFRCLFLKN